MKKDIRMSNIESPSPKNTKKLVGNSWAPLFLAFASIIVYQVLPETVTLIKWAFTLGSLYYLAGMIFRGKTGGIIFWTLICLAIIFNPIFPVNLGNQALWYILDFLALVAMLIAFFRCRDINVVDLYRNRKKYNKLEFYSNPRGRFLKIFYLFIYISGLIAWIVIGGVNHYSDDEFYSRDLVGIEEYAVNVKCKAGDDINRIDMSLNRPLSKRDFPLFINRYKFGTRSDVDRELNELCKDLGVTVRFVREELVKVPNTPNYVHSIAQWGPRYLDMDIFLPFIGMLIGFIVIMEGSRRLFHHLFFGRKSSLRMNLGGPQS